MDKNKTQLIVDCFKLYTDKNIVISSDILNLFKIKTYKKGDQYLVANNIWNDFSIIADGVIRLYYIDSDGKEHTKGLYDKKAILAPCAPSAIGKPVNFNIDCFDDTTVLKADYQKIREYLGSTSWGPFLLIGLLEFVLDDKVEREYAWLNLDAESRYLKFLSENRSISNKVPLYIIASYLGMTDVTLSRIRKKLDLT